jgi:hypothetical protein
VGEILSRNTKRLTVTYWPLFAKARLTYKVDIHVHSVQFLCRMFSFAAM